MARILAPDTPLRRRLHRYGRRLLDTLLPPLCPGCGEDLPERHWICLDCRRDFRRAPGETRCLECLRDGESGVECADPDHAHARARTAFRMLPPLDAVIHEFKYRGRRDLGNPLGRLLARGIEGPADALLVGVPLHRVRRRERGYDQTDLLARGISREWGAPVVAELLRRSRATSPQARLDRGRRVENLRGAFAVPRPELVRGRCVVVVDDVTTSGATLLEAARVLREAGTREVRPVALAGA